MRIHPIILVAAILGLVGALLWVGLGVRYQLEIEDKAEACEAKGYDWAGNRDIGYRCYDLREVP